MSDDNLSARRVLLDRVGRKTGIELRVEQAHCADAHSRLTEAEQCFRTKQSSFDQVRIRLLSLPRDAKQPVDAHQRITHLRKILQTQYSALREACAEVGESRAAHSLAAKSLLAAQRRFNRCGELQEIMREKICETRICARQEQVLTAAIARKAGRGGPLDIGNFSTSPLPAINPGSGLKLEADYEEALGEAGCGRVNPGEDIRVNEGRSILESQQMVNLFVGGAGNDSVSRSASTSQVSAPEGRSGTASRDQQQSTQGQVSLLEWWQKSGEQGVAVSYQVKAGERFEVSIADGCGGMDVNVEAESLAGQRQLASQRRELSKLLKDAGMKVQQLRTGLR